MSRRIGYEVLTLSAERLIFEADCRKDCSGPEYRLDLTDGYIKRPQAVMAYEKRADNALFHQLRKCIERKEGRIVRDDDEEALYQYIIFVSFDAVFRKFRSIDTSGIIEAIENGPVPYSVEDHLSHILNPGEGITITFKDGTVKRFVPFDKSANMARSCRISYVSTDIRDELDEALRLGIDFAGLEMHLSKYYAYRGLYLTTGTRIDLGDSFALNEKSVVVIKDTKVSPHDEAPLLFYDCSTEEERRQGKPHRFKVGNRDIEINAFDGEGFISPELCEYINGGLGHEPGTVSSLQIRMPFIKGMLHSVDYMKFVKDIGEIENARITDCFGIERSLSEVRIILTESMFKARGWLEEYWTGMLGRSVDEDNDPMKFFFGKVNEYGHGLYVCGSNASFFPSGFERLNYQFIATMDMAPETFEGLVGKHFEYGEERIRKIFRPEKESDARNTLIAAAVKNPLFYLEPRLLAQAEHEVRNLRINCGKGSLMTTGEHRFLSGDLFSLLLILSRNAMATTQGKVQTEKYYKTLEFNETQYDTFYMPDWSFGPNRENLYALLRSPHLSRNEQTLLIPRKTEENDIYDEYFGHLKGVIMLPSKSLVQNILGGADFDGDMVKIYSDENIIQAVKDGSYDEEADRTLPIVDIPSEDGEKKRISGKEFVKLIINTFSSSTGLISNLALMFADREYRYDLDYDYEERPDPAESLCAYATACAGCEIDSAKKGAHPVADIRFLQENAKGLSDTMQAFIDAKNVFKNLSGKRYKTEKTTIRDDSGSGTPVYKVVRYSRNEKDLFIRIPEEGSLNLSRLPYEFAVRDFTGDGAEKDRDAVRRLLPVPDSGYRGSRFLFEDEEPEYARRTLRPEGKKQARALIKAYLDARNDIASYEDSIERLQSTKAYKKLVILLKLKYDSLEETVLPLSGYTVQDALLSSMGYAMELFRSSQDVSDAIDRLVSSEWSYTPADGRTEKLETIMGAEPGTIPPECSELVCDFSFDGFLALPFLLKAVMANRMLEQDPEAFLSDEERDDRNDDYGYYKMFVKEYKKTSNVIFDDASDEDDDEKDDEGTSPAEADWKKTFNDLAYARLIEIARTASPEASEKRIERIAVEYAHDARKDADANGTFFWDVLPRQTILDNVKETRNDHA